MRILVRQLAQEVDRLVCLGQLFGEPANLLFQLFDLASLWVIVPDGLVRDVACLTSILHGADVLVNLGVARIEAGNHKAVAVASQTLPQQARELRVTIRNMAVCSINQSFDHIAKGLNRSYSIYYSSKYQIYLV